MFGTGTAAVVSPVGDLKYKDDLIHISDGIGPITQRLYDEITGIQLGKLPDRFNWVQTVE